jgi:hypothetical protein
MTEPTKEQIENINRLIEKVTLLPMENYPTLAQQIADLYKDYVLPQDCITAEQFQVILKKAGYVRLADDQSLPKMAIDWYVGGTYQPITVFDLAQIIEKSQQDMLNAGWRKVEL